MNERIRKLADEALIHANKTWNPDSDAAFFVEIAMGKHAELIIQECAQACLDEGAKFRGEQDITDFKLCASVIKQHFGVE